MAEFETLLNLQLFADGGSAAAGNAAGAGTSAGATSTADSGTASAAQGVKNGSDAAYTNETPDRNAQFENLIRGEFKDLYDARVQDTIQKRLKGTKETVERYEKLAPTLDLLAKKYGVSADDLDGLSKAIEEDDSFFEDEAMEKGISVEQLKYIRKIEKENASVKKQMAEQESRERANQLYSRWMKEAESAKAVYPTFDLQAEMQNEQFVSLLRANVDVRSAYEVVHKDDIIRGAMQFTADKVQQKVANRVAANGSRPAENGMSNTAASLTQRDVSTLTKAEREELILRAQRGERITFK